MKKKKWFLVITSILLMLLTCTQIQAAAIKAPANIKVTASKKASVSRQQATAQSWHIQ